MIERYKRVDAKTLELDMTIDDPGQRRISAATQAFHLLPVLPGEMALRLFAGRLR
jgi:hypothetical protein